MRNTCLMLNKMLLIFSGNRLKSDPQYFWNIWPHIFCIKEPQTLDVRKSEVLTFRVKRHIVAWKIPVSDSCSSVEEFLLRETTQQVYISFYYFRFKIIFCKFKLFVFIFCKSFFYYFFRCTYMWAILPQIFVIKKSNYLFHNIPIIFITLFSFILKMLLNMCTLVYIKKYLIFSINIKYFFNNQLDAYLVLIIPSNDKFVTN